MNKILYGGVIATGCLCWALQGMEVGMEVAREASEEVVISVPPTTKIASLLQLQKSIELREDVAQKEIDFDVLCAYLKRYDKKVTQHTNEEEGIRKVKKRLEKVKKERPEQIKELLELLVKAEKERIEEMSKLNGESSSQDSIVQGGNPSSSEIEWAGAILAKTLGLVNQHLETKHERKKVQSKRERTLSIVLATLTVVLPIVSGYIGSTMGDCSCG